MDSRNALSRFREWSLIKERIVKYCLTENILPGSKLLVTHQSAGWRVSVYLSVCVCRGVLIGIPVLRNLVAHKWELRLRWVALAVFMLFIVFAVCFNIFYAAHFPPTDWRACCPMPCLSYPVCY